MMVCEFAFGNTADVAGCLVRIVFVDGYCVVCSLGCFACMGGCCLCLWFSCLVVDCLICVLRLAWASAILDSVVSLILGFSLLFVCWLVCCYRLRL